MKQINIRHFLLKAFLLLVAGFISEVSYAQDKMLTFDLETFVLAVKENNIQLKIAKNNSNMAALSIKEAIAALLPQINAQAAARRNFNKQFTFFEGPDFENIDPVTGEIPIVMQKFQMGFNNEFQAHVVLEQNLFSLKKINDLISARQYADIGKLQSKNKSINIISESKKAFLQTVLIKRVYEVSIVSEQFAKENYSAAKNKFENQLISELDLLQAKIRWEEERPRLLKAKRNYLILLGNLKVIAGINPTDSIALNYNLAEYKFNYYTVNSNDVINNRVDYQLLEANNYFQKLDIETKKSEYYPTLNLNVGYSYFSGSNELTVTENQNKVGYASVSLTIPILSSGYRKIQIDKARILSENAALEKQEAKLSMTIEIQNLEMKLSEEYKTIQVATSIQETAARAYEIAIETAEIGLTSQLDLRKISNDYKRAEINLYGSIYTFKCTQIDFNNAIANY